MIAFLFPGQGSQHAGMGKDLAENFTVARQVFEEANDALGVDLASLCFNGPEEDLKLTANTQPAILTTSIAALRVLETETGIAPNYAAGHSLGEYSALVCAGSLAFADTIALVQERGNLMQQAVPAGSGAMAAILGLDDDVVREVCAAAAADEVVEAVNFNSPDQVVVAGQKTAVEHATEIAKEKDAKRAVVLPVSVPSHCSLMQPAAEQLAERLQAIEIKAPAIKVINNVDVASATSADEIRDALVRQLYQPVRWVETIQAMHELGITTVIESGPGKVLAGLNKRIVKSMTALPVYDTASLTAALAS